MDSWHRSIQQTGAHHVEEEFRSSSNFFLELARSILEALRVDKRKSTPRFLTTLERRNVNIKYIISSGGDRTHNLSRFQSHARAPASRLASLVQYFAYFLVIFIFFQNHRFYCNIFFYSPLPVQTGTLCELSKKNCSFKERKNINYSEWGFQTIIFIPMAYSDIFQKGSWY